jgi:hypothetical protein
LVRPFSFQQTTVPLLLFVALVVVDTAVEYSRSGREERFGWIRFCLLPQIVDVCCRVSWVIVTIGGGCWCFTVLKDREGIVLLMPHVLETKPVYAFRHLCRVQHKYSIIELQPSIAAPVTPLAQLSSLLIWCTSTHLDKTHFADPRHYIKSWVSVNEALHSILALFPNHLQISQYLSIDIFLVLAL